MKKINMKKNYTEKEIMKTESGNKSYIRRISGRIVNEKVRIILAGTILGGILLPAVFVSASENEFNTNEIFKRKAISDFREISDKNDIYNSNLPVEVKKQNWFQNIIIFIKRCFNIKDK